MKKKIKKIILWKPWVSGLVIGLVLALGVPALALTLTGSVDEIKALFGSDQSYAPSLGGNVEATGGICSGSEPATTMCNVDINNLDVTTALAVDGTLQTTGIATLSNAQLVTGGITTYVSAGSFTDATTTIVSVVNPFGTSATSTVELVRLNITAVATSSAEDISCGGSTTAYAAPTYDILDTGEIVATSTLGVIENNIATAYNGNSAGVGGGAIPKITLTPKYPYLVCTVTAVIDGGFVGADNTFAGNYEIRFRE
jgi:hypothetical protein